MFAQRIKQILAEAEVGSTISISGWVQKKQKRSTFTFIDLNDGSSLQGLQIIIDNDVEGYEDFVRLSRVGASVQAEGNIVESQGKQRIEMHATAVTVLGTVADDYPIQAKRQTPEFLREKAHLRARTKIMSASMRVRSNAAQAIHSFFKKHDFAYVHTPIITASDCEGAGEMFSVTTMLPEDTKKPLPRTPDGKIDFNKDFFGKHTGLTVSGQLQVESFSVSMSDAYTFGPTFRAEVSHTSRHLAEFWMIEPEIA